MSKLQEEIASTQMTVSVDPHRNKDEQNVLVDSLLDSISGGWVNAFAKWTKSF